MSAALRRWLPVIKFPDEGDVGRRSWPAKTPRPVTDRHRPCTGSRKRRRICHLLLTAAAAAAAAAAAVTKSGSRHYADDVWHVRYRHFSTK